MPRISLDHDKLNEHDDEYIRRARDLVDHLRARADQIEFDLDLHESLWRVRHFVDADWFSRFR